jgi:hypothetical protein
MNPMARRSLDDFCATHPGSSGCMMSLGLGLELLSNGVSVSESSYMCFWAFLSREKNGGSRRPAVAEPLRLGEHEEVFTK